MKKAYTLIELVVVTGVITVLVGMGVVYYSTFTIEKQLEAQARKIGDVLELSRKKSSAADLSVPCGSGENLKGFRVNISSATNYDLEQQCCLAANPSTCTTTTINGYVMQFPNISATSATGYILYHTLSAGATITSLGNPIVLKHATANKCINITVATTGTVNIGSVYSC